jgi:hypothetical protein
MQPNTALSCKGRAPMRRADLVSFSALLDALKRQLATASTHPLSGLYLSHVLIGKSAAGVLGQAR